AILGAAGLGDIGEHFPDTDERFKGADSSELLKAALEKIKKAGWQVINVDTNIIAQAPKLKPYKKQMQELIAGLLEIESSCVNVKARTNEELDAVGQKQAIAAQAVVLLQRKTATN
ncbi:MAG: 2-C-methyl-D-erythritol 2,4-cyclodiphosphate synthase, partial [Planctomycetes bacterium]|nr:2-C-methyl-D-erythritol 2,4-cyclodiphosphate synthase [Planctomycetota bacterium]